jgi:hypothetical protein
MVHHTTHTISKRTDLHFFHHGDFLGSYQPAEQGDYTRLIWLYLLTYPNPNLRLN